MTLEPPQLVVSLFLLSSLFLLLFALLQQPAPQKPAHRRMAERMGAQARATPFDQPVLGPLLNLALAVVEAMPAARLRRLVERDLAASGNPKDYTVNEYLALCLGAGVALAAGSAVLGLTLGLTQPAWPITIGVIGAVAGIWNLHETGRSRTRRIAKQLPYTLDLIGLVMSAGSSFYEAIETLIHDNPEDELNQELQICLQEIHFGTPRSTALSRMAERVPLDTLRSVVGAINQAESLGTPLSGILSVQAQMLRNQRSVQAEKISASASLRILVPSMLILLAVVLTVFAPLVIRLVRGDLMGI